MNFLLILAGLMLFIAGIVLYVFCRQSQYGLTWLGAALTALYLGIGAGMFGIGIQRIFGG